MILKVLGSFLITAFLTGFAFADEASEPCDSIESCLALIPQITIEEWNAGEIEESHKAKILSFGRETLPYLLALLEHPNPNVVAVSDQLIGDLSDLNSSDLSMVKEAIGKKRGAFGRYIMSYFAIATIGSQDAIEFLIQELIRTGNSPSQIGIAFRRLGRKGIPTLMSALEAGDLCKRKKCIQIHEIFEYMGEEARDAVPMLLKVAMDKEQPLEIRKLAIKSLGKIGVFAQATGPDLLKLEKENSVEFKHTIIWALVGMRHPLALKFFDLDWDVNKDIGARLRDLASMREGAYMSGPKILEVLQSDNWDNKVDAARALGFIGYESAIPDLIDALTNPVDWQLAFVSAEALEMLMAERALPDLKKVSETHWYPIVRVAAKKAYDNIQGKNPNSFNYNSGNFAFDFFAYEWISYEIEPCLDYEALLDNINAKRTNNGLDLEGDFYQEYFFSARNFCAYDNVGEIISKQECLEPKIANYPQGIKKVEDGLLVYGDWGEWGGEIVFFHKDNNSQVILGENTEDIHFLENGIFAITGLAHLVFNDGKIYELKQNFEKVWEAIPVVRLPGAPNFSKKITATEILVHANGGSVIFSSPNNLEMAVCKKEGKFN